MAENDVENLAVAAPMTGRRRRFTSAEKRRFLAEAEGPGETMSSVGRRYGLSVSLLFRWRRQLTGESRRPSPRPGPQQEIARLTQKVLELQRLLADAVDENRHLQQQLQRAGVSVVPPGRGEGISRIVRDGRA